MNVVSLNDRRARLGGSTLPAACGVDPYRSPIRLWLELTGRVPREETEAQRIGQLLEDDVFVLLNDAGFPCERTPDAELTDDALTWLVGHPDGFGSDDHGPFVAEAKASGRPWDSLPLYYAAQAQTYMHLSERPHTVVGQLQGTTFSVWHVERHPHAMEMMLNLGAAFVECVRDNVMPAPLGHADDRKALALAYQDAPAGVQVRESREVREWRRELAALQEAHDKRAQRIELLRARIQAYMGDADTLLDAHDATVATWKQTTTTRTDVKGLRAEYPGVAAKFVTTTSTRRFLLK